MTYHAFYKAPDRLIPLGGQSTTRGNATARACRKIIDDFSSKMQKSCRRRVVVCRSSSPTSLVFEVLAQRRSTLEALPKNTGPFRRRKVRVLS